MSQAVDLTSASPPVETQDLVGAIQRVLQESAEPLTVAKIRAHLPGQFRGHNVEETVQRQATANVFHVFPKYRSQHERYWDRPMPVHVAALVRGALQEGPLPDAELRRKLPAYAQPALESVVAEELAKGRLHRHPRATSRGGERLGATPPDPKDYLAPELSILFARLEPMGFSVSRLRQAALELLHDEEWAPAPPPPRPERKPKGEDQAPADKAAAVGQPASAPQPPAQSS